MGAAWPVIAKMPVNACSFELTNNTELLPVVTNDPEPAEILNCALICAVWAVKIKDPASTTSEILSETSWPIVTNDPEPAEILNCAVICAVWAVKIKDPDDDPRTMC